MSRNTVSPLHIEWAPGWVQAVNIVSGETASGATVSQLGSLLNGHRQALVGVGRNHVFLKAQRLPKAAPDDLRRILSVQMGQLFPLPPDQLAFDFIQTSDQTSEGCLTIIAAMRSEDLTQLRAELQQVGLTATRVLPVSLGSPLVALHAGMTDALVIESTVTGLVLDVVQDGVVRLSRVAPRDSDPECEALRTMAAARAENLPLVAAGLVPFPKATRAAGTALTLLHEAVPFAFELAEDRVRELKKRVAARNRLAVLMMMSAILLVLLVWTDWNDALAKVTRSQGSWARQLSVLRSIRDGETAKAQQATAVESVLKGSFETAQPLSDLMSAVGDSLPAGGWLTGINIERGKLIQIRGTAKTSGDVGRFVDALGATPRFRDVRLVFANTAKIADTQVVQFNVTAIAVGNLPMPVPEKAGARGSRKLPASSRTGAGA